MNKAILIHTNDNVATAIEEIKAGLVSVIGLGDFNVNVDIPKGHKFAVKPIQNGQSVIKYNVPIGIAISDINTGDYVHIHNLKSITDNRSNSFDSDALPSDMSYDLE